MAAPTHRVVIAVALTGLVGATGATATGGSRSACVAAPVHYEPPQDPSAPKIPWIRSGRITGYLFYYGARGPWRQQRERVLVPIRGGGPGFDAKILWHARGHSRRLILSGRRLDGNGVLVEQYSGFGRGGYFPSILDVPAAGCWRVTVGTGERHASFAFVAVAVP